MIKEGGGRTKIVHAKAYEWLLEHNQLNWCLYL